jgi:hypothetical protein
MGSVDSRRGMLFPILALRATSGLVLRSDRVTTKKRATTTHRWEITLVRERGKFLGFVEAADEKAAIEEAIRASRSRTRSSRSD